MNVLITGGSGFIGKHLSVQLLAQGHSVWVLTRTAAKARAQVPADVTLVEQLEGLQGIEAVINLAGENLAGGRWSASRKAAFRSSRIETTKRLVAWMQSLTQRPQVLVSGSAIGYYGDHADDVLTEADPPASDFAALLCRDWEGAAEEASVLGVRVCRVRIGIVLGTDGGALAKMLPPFRLGLGGRMGDGRQWMSWIHRDDLVHLLCWLLQTRNAVGAFNATAPTPVRNAEFSSVLARVLGRPALLPMPALALRTMFGEMASLLLGGQQVQPARAESLGFAFRYAKLEPALRDLLSESNESIQ